jgi:hypothetical protein
VFTSQKSECKHGIALSVLRQGYALDFVDVVAPVIRLEEQQQLRFQALLFELKIELSKI